MKRFLRRAAAFSAVLVLAVAAAATVQAVALFVHDTAHLLAPNDHDTLSHQLQALFDKSSVRGLLITVPTTGGVVPDRYARELAEKWDLNPRLPESRSFLILLAVAEKRVEITVSSGLSKSLPPQRVNQILEQEVLPVLREGRVASALYIGIKKMDERIPASSSSFPKEWTAGTATPPPIPSVSKNETGKKTAPAKKGGPGSLWLLAVLAAGVLILRRFNPRRKWKGLSGGPAPALSQPSPLRFGGPPRSRGLGAGRDF